MKLSLKNTFVRSCGFAGGIYLPRPSERTTAAAVQTLPTPPMLYVLMQQHDGPASALCVEPGEAVQAGQCIGHAEMPGSLNVHSPLAGCIVGITRADSARRADVLAVQIAVDCEQATREGIPAQANSFSRNPEGMRFSLEQIPAPTNLGTGRDSRTSKITPPSLDELVAAAERAGLTDFQTRAHSLADALHNAGQRDVRHLIVNMLPGEPIPFAAAIDLESDPTTIARASQWVGQALNVHRTWLAIDREHRRMSDRMRSAARRTSVRVVELANKYPQHMPVLLAATIAGVQTPPGGTTLDVGVLVLDWQAVLGLAAALEFDGHQPTPMTHRDISVSGPAVTNPGRYRIPIGTPFEHILRHVGLKTTVRRVVEGGPMTGQAVSHLGVVVTKNTSALLVLDRTGERVPSPGPCIRCGWCQEDCPVGLDPQAILDLAERGQWSAAQRLHPMACVECGLCSYVCPAELPLSINVIQSKAHYRQ